MDVSIIIVNYNTKDLIKNCINSIYKHTKDVDFEIIVSDNGSVDGSVEMIKSEFPNVILIENNANLGFGAANNRGLKIAKGKYIFYLNSDTVLLNNAVKYFFDYWETSPEKDQIGALGSNLLDENFTLTHSFGNFPSIKKILNNTIFDFFRIIRLTVFFFLDESFSFTNSKQKSVGKMKHYYGIVDYITGADLFLRNDLNAQYDEKYFLYYEDTDLQMRLKLKNLERRIIDGPKIQHLEHKSNQFNKKIDYYQSISKVNLFLSSIIFLKKYQYNFFIILLLKFIISLCWISPFLVKKNSKYIFKLWRL